MINALQELEDKGQAIDVEVLDLKELEVCLSFEENNAVVQRRWLFGRLSLFDFLIQDWCKRKFLKSNFDPSANHRHSRYWNWHYCWRRTGMFRARLCLFVGERPECVLRLGY